MRLQALNVKYPELCPEMLPQDAQVRSRASMDTKQVDVDLQLMMQQAA